MIPHDEELYAEALQLTFCDKRWNDIIELCITQEGKDAIMSLERQRYHEEEAKAGMI